VRSEPELKAAILMRLVYLRFLGYDWEDEIPNHLVTVQGH